MTFEKNRILSLRLLGIAIAAFIFVKFFSGSIAGSCRNAGCVGVAAGTAVVGFGIGFLLMATATFYAVRSYSRIEGRRSSLRVLELWGFWLLTLLMFMMTLGSFRF
ncbi:hypothetical protein KY495_18835 [Massilia sp. PAMC28688]|uniref:hypothetical protein n=1 Tax=Massilia sp. PAMC28688 TaxID=2861283 RepID=UPI001C633751|nr:hypothetical protein [Massilia sp. PAMC28688]QYF92763.1 hypothetical protein KY495_18835 [Massilia sp. PAMC28688]